MSILIKTYFHNPKKFKDALIMQELCIKNNWELSKELEEILSHEQGKEIESSLVNESTRMIDLSKLDKDVKFLTIWDSE